MTIPEQLAQTKGFLTVKQLASLLTCHPMTIYGWCSEGKLPHTRIGSRLKFDPAAVRGWLTQRQID
jgi:excisionase family DNA binding protein